MVTDSSQRKMRWSDASMSTVRTPLELRRSSYKSPVWRPICGGMGCAVLGHQARHGVYEHNARDNATEALLGRRLEAIEGNTTTEHGTISGDYEFN